MSTGAAQPFSGTYRAEPVHSSFAFAVRHSIELRLERDDGGAE